MAYLLVFASLMVLIVATSATGSREQTLALFVFQMERYPKLLQRLLQAIAHNQFQFIGHPHHIGIVAAFGAHAYLQQFETVISFVGFVPDLVVIQVVVATEVVAYNGVYLRTRLEILPEMW